MTEVPPLGAIVELLPDMEQYYKGATAGWRGVVKDHKVDDGFDLIYVSWDQTYWRYDSDAGQRDGWTYPAHFTVIGQHSMTPEQFASQMVEEVEHGEAPETPVCAHCGGDHAEEDRRRVFLEMLQAATAEAAQGEGFALFYVQRVEDEQNLTITPYMISSCLTDEATALIEAQLVKVAETCVEKFMFEYMKRFT